MITINNSEQKAVYLDHNALIIKSYNKYTENNEQYRLQPHLFSFKPLKNGQKLNPNCRKRKAKSSNVSPEISKLKLTCAFLLTKLKEINDFKHFQQEFSENTCRIWEELNTFPQFHGENARNDFQKFILNNQEYLIPPRCRFFNHDLLKLEELLSKNLNKYDFIIIDPPWKNKYIRRIKKAKNELGYKMLDNDLLSDINLNLVIHSDTIVAIWCTNSKQHQQRMLEEFFPRWDLKLIHKIVWLKLNTDGELISEINEEGKKQPYEVLFIASHNDAKTDFREITKLEFIMSVPSIIHSHKPPIVDLFRDILPENPKMLELFARYLQPGFTSIGLEVMKLMDTRLYEDLKVNN